MKTPLFSLSSADVFRHGKQILFDISFEIFKGEHTAIMGPNGSGKSTLLSLLTREILPVYKNPPAIQIAGNSLGNLFEFRKTVGIVSERVEKEFYTPDITGRNAVLSGFFGSVGVFRSQFPSQEEYQKVDEIMEELSLTSLREKPMQEMSAGERQRILLARALIHDPKALILDEPTNALDMVATAEFLKILRILSQKNVTIILITHHLHEVFPEISKVIFMKEGKIAYNGKKNDLLTSPIISDVFGALLEIEEKSGYFSLKTPLPSHV